MNGAAALRRIHTTDGLDGGPSRVTGAARATVRLAGFVAILTVAFMELAWLGARGALRREAQARAFWLQRISRRLVRLLDLRIEYHGEAAASGVLVFNHLSYLDIVVLAARDPMLFVAKADVRAWPVLGWIAAAAGTIFIERSRRCDVARVSETLMKTGAGGIRVCIFPEGTSSDGSRVLPFHSSLLEPAVRSEWPVTAGWLGYALEDGSAGMEVCYWGDMSFGPHFLRLLTKRTIQVKVKYRVVQPARSDRKQLGRDLHAVVSGLSASET